jgi:hypothetical protein
MEELWETVLPLLVSNSQTRRVLRAPINQDVDSLNDPICGMLCSLKDEFRDKFMDDSHMVLNR